MPKYNDMDKLNSFLIENEVNPKDNHAKKKFFEEYFNWDMLCKKYKQGSTIKDICKETNLTYDTVRSNLKRNNIHLRNSTKDGRYESDYSFDFDCLINLNEKGAYLLGWIYADGSIQDYRLRFQLQERDRPHLEYLAGLYSDKPVYDKRNEWTFYSVELSNLLQDKYDISTTKSYEDYDIMFDKYPKELQPYLILGLFEGDGSISKAYLGCEMLMPEKSLNSFFKCLKDNKVNIEYKRINKLNKHGLCQVSFKGVSYFQFLQFIYNNTKKVTPLKRKYSRFIIQLERSANGKTSPYRKLARDIRYSLRTIEI